MPKYQPLLSFVLAYVNDCYDVIHCRDWSRNAPINPSLTLASNSLFKVTCNDCFSYIAAGVRLQYRVEGGLVPRLKLFQLSVYGDVRAEMHLDAKLYD